MSLLERSRSGDSEALRKVVELLEPDIERLSRRMRMEREDAKQTLRTELIGLVLGERR
ncbi:helix-turn-helix domain-containing protein [Saccharibacillus alkalitolerans]|nr:helix-turn-helix domain-containing protein [Saccharibacillus alkalitolerans]